ncbi:MAG: PIN domain-containing protein [Burkholderiaceae bacterium]|jgi:toxin-antitoxin system PIN domain toxin|nr:PIN domain-containing protein [Burkholderiaceae bacterium]
MIALDANLLVYAHRAENPFHTAAAKLVSELAEGKAAWAIPWPCLHEFYGVITNPRIHAVPTPIDVAVDQIEAWFESPTLHLLSETPEHWPYLRELIAKAKVQGPLVHDARIAALCLAHGVRELWSADRDFSRFPSLRVRNPLV